jgi:heat shock protein HtpX
MFRWFGARPLAAMEIPGLFRLLAEVCRRAGLSRLPGLYYIAAPSTMNAFACGGPHDAAIIVTEGLLRSMSVGEITGILAHEVAHIRNHDAWAMHKATMLMQIIEWTSAAGLASRQGRNDRNSLDRALTTLLTAAPALSRLLLLALSRIREFDADATALELTKNTEAMVAALAKLEHHHASAPVMTAFDNDPMRFLRSHPTTSARVEALLGFAC